MPFGKSILLNCVKLCCKACIKTEDVLTVVIDLSWQCILYEQLDGIVLS